MGKEAVWQSPTKLFLHHVYHVRISSEPIYKPTFDVWYYALTKGNVYMLKVRIYSHGRTNNNPARFPDFDTKRICKVA